MKLISRGKADYSSERYHDHVLEQYRIWAQCTDAHEDRIETTNRFFLTLSVAILSGLLFILKQDVPISGVESVALGFFTVLFCSAWWSVLHSADKLNIAKHEILEEIEAHLPIRPFHYEWNSKLGSGRRYFRIKLAYQLVPAIISLIYIVFLVVVYLQGQSKSHG